MSCHKHIACNAVKLKGYKNVSRLEFRLEKKRQKQGTSISGKNCQTATSIRCDTDRIIKNF